MNDADEITQMLCQSALDFVTARNDLNSQREHLGRPHGIDRELWRSMADLGWLGLSVPETLGGSGMGADVAAPLCEVLGRHLFAQPYIAAALQPAAVIGVTGGDTGALMAEGLVSGERLFCLAWQENAGATELATPTTRVDGGRLTGRKLFVAGLEDDSRLLVYAQQAGKPVFVSVDAAADGVSINRCATAQGVYCEVCFDQVELDERAPLLAGGAAASALRQALSVARVTASAQLAGIARGCLSHTVDYVNQRVQFGRPIGSFQSVKHRCVDLHIAVELADACWREAATELAVAGDVDLPSVYAAKARCSDVARQVCRSAVQLHGAMGFTEESDIGLFLRAALQYSSWMGSPVKMRRRFMALSKNFLSSPEVANA